MIFMYMDSIRCYSNHLAHVPAELKHKNELVRHGIFLLNSLMYVAVELKGLQRAHPSVNSYKHSIPFKYD